MTRKILNPNRSANKGLVNVGTPNKGNGDPIRTSFVKLNSVVDAIDDNFAELYGVDQSTKYHLGDDEIFINLDPDSGEIVIQSKYDSAMPIYIKGANASQDGVGGNVIIEAGAPPLAEGLIQDGGAYSGTVGNIEIAGNQTTIDSLGQVWTFRDDGALETPNGQTIISDPTNIVLQAQNGAGFVAGDQSWLFDSSGKLNVSSLFPRTFTAILDSAHMQDPSPAVSLNNIPWQMDVTFSIVNGQIETTVEQIFPILNNPGYNSGFIFGFTVDDHGIPGYGITIELLNVTHPGGAGWTANVAVSPPPELPATIYSHETIKLTSDATSWTFGPDGNLTLPDGGVIKNSDGTEYGGGSGGSSDRLVASGKSVILGTDGVLSLAGDVNFKYGGAIWEGGHGQGGRGWQTGLNIVGAFESGANTPIRIYPHGGDGKGLNMGSVVVKNDRVEIYGQLVNDSVGTFWTFKNDGSTTFPNGSKLDGGTSYKFATDNSVTQYIDLRDTSGRGFYTDSNGFTLRSNNSNNWVFSPGGNLTFPNNSAFDGQTLTDHATGANYTLKIANGGVAGTKFGIGTGSADFGIANDALNHAEDGYVPYSVTASRINLTVLGAGSWVFDNTGSLTVPGDIKSTAGVGDVVIEANDGTLRTWTFGGDGNLTLPGGLPGTTSIINSGGFGSIGADGSSSIAWTDSDSNPTQISAVTADGNTGVVIQAGAVAGGPPVPDYQWTFGTDGTLTLPGDIRGPATYDPFGGLSGHTVSIAPTSDAPTKKFNFRIDQFGEPYTRAYLDMPQAENNRQVAITFPHANDTCGYIFTQGANNYDDGMNNAFNLLYNSGDIKLTAEGTDGLKTYKFGNDGTLTLPNDATIASVDTGFKTTFTTNGDGHLESNTNSITIGIGDSALVAAITADPQNYLIHFDWDNTNTFYVISSITGPRGGTNVYTLTGTWPADGGAFPIDLVDGFYVRGGRTIIGVHQLAIEAGGKTLLFDDYGTLKVPGNISFNSDTAGIGNSIDLSQDITISSGKNVIIKPGSSGVVGTTSWLFGEDSLTFPDSTQQTTAYQQVAVPVTSKGVGGDTAGRIAFDSDYIYYCTASYDGDNNIWKRVALSTDTWDYTPPPPVTYSLTVITAGDGYGTVTSSPAGISSPTLTATFAENTSVTLSANAQIGSTFAGWSGAAAGLAPAQITMDGDKTVTATFDLNSPPTPTLVSIDITPRDYTIDIYLETSLQLTAMGTYSDSSTENLTATVEWASTNTNFATFSGSTPGLLEVTVGYNPATDGTTTTVTATLGGIQGTAYEYGTDSTPPPPPPPPTPSYNYSVDNVTPSLGTPVTVTITTTDVEDGTTLYWQLTNTQTPSGFDTDTSGSITISGNTAAVTITMTDDGGFGNHTVPTIQWTFNLYSDSGYLDQLLQCTAGGTDQYV